MIHTLKYINPKYSVSLRTIQGYTLYCLLKHKIPPSLILRVNTSYHPLGEELTGNLQNISFKNPIAFQLLLDDVLTNYNEN